ncbi:MAG: hypothetical protein R3F02_14905 [Thiolinea sp.]
MSPHNKNNTQADLNEQALTADAAQETLQESKPHIIRRNIEDYLADRALKKRLTDIFDDDFLLD